MSCCGGNCGCGAGCKCGAGCGGCNNMYDPAAETAAAGHKASSGGMEMGGKSGGCDCATCKCGASCGCSCCSCS